MKITRFRKSISGKNIVYSADFVPRRLDLRERVFFKVPRAYKRGDYPYDAFFVAAVPMAMALQENLEFDAIVSETLYKRIHGIKKYINEPSSSTKITVKGTVKRKKTSFANGLFFTLGIDSTHSLISSAKFSKKNRVNYLLFMNGSHSFEVSPAVLKTVQAKIRKWGKWSSAKPIFIDTNLRKIADKIINWDYFHGAGIAAAAHLISPYVGKMYISNQDSYVTDEPAGTGPVIDKMWSNEALSFTSLFPNSKRLDKIKEIIRSKRYREYLKDIWICTEKPASPNRLNCGVCEKCVKNTLRFIAMGAKKSDLAFFFLNKELFDTLVPQSGPTTSWEKFMKPIYDKKLLDVDMLSSIERYLKRRIRIERVKKSQERFNDFKKKVKRLLIKFELLDEILYLKNHLRAVYTK